MSVRKDSVLEDLKIPFSKFILAVKLFILEAVAYKAHKELEILRTRSTQNLNS